MPTTQTLAVWMPADVAATMHAAIEVGDYGSKEEITEEALRDWSRARDAELAFSLRQSASATKAAP